MNWEKLAKERGEENVTLRTQAAAFEADYNAMQRECSRVAILADLMTWVQAGKYRSITHRHTGTFRANDQAFNVSWEADTLQGLLNCLNEHVPTERAP
jgi:hypothetical protein